MRRTVAILGGGVAGMSAAQELAERGLEVTVYEAGATEGGKARSIWVPGSGVKGRRGLPGEHGFRFFPSFYKHLPDTLSRIPYGRNPRGVLDNLVTTRRTRLARSDGSPLDMVTRFPRDVTDWRTTWDALRSRGRTGIPDEEFARFAHTVLTFLTTCEERRLYEYEDVGWWEYLEADRRSEGFRLYFAQVAVRALVAMRPEAASLRTVSAVGLQLLLDHFRRGQEVNRLLNGPTTDVWLRPWRTYLEQLGVLYRAHTPVRALRVEKGRVVDVLVEGPDGPEQVVADAYVCALPVEVMSRLLEPALLDADPRLERLHRLRTSWMVGLQFFLKHDVPVVPGHFVLVDAPWALTGISQPQFWPQGTLSRYGSGQAKGLLSIDISDWETPGRYVPKAARDCTREEVAREVWKQLEAHLGRGALRESDVVGWYLADSVEVGPDGQLHNREPLLTNTVGSWWDRPEAITALPNLFLASDYVRTHTDLATMEGANEAARRAVNGVLDTLDVSAPRCQLWPLEEPALFAPLKALDRARLLLGMPHALAAGAPARERSVPPGASVTTFERVLRAVTERGEAA